MSEKAEYVATIDMTQVEKSLDSARAKQSEYFGAVEKGFFSLEGAAKKTQAALGPQAAAISSIANALGDKNNQMGKAIQLSGQLAAAWAAGGPLGLAVAGLSAALIELQKHWDDELAAQERAIEKSTSVAEAEIAHKKNIEARNAELRKQSLSETMQVTKRIDQEIAAVRQKLADEGLLTSFVVGADRVNRKRVLLETIELLQDERELEVEAIERAKKKPIAAAAKTGGGVDFSGAIDAIRKRRAEQHDKDLDEYFDNEEKGRALEMKSAEKWAAERAAIDKRYYDAKEANERIALEREQHALEEQLALRKGYAAEALGIGVNASEQLIDAVITGQKDALAHFAASVAKQAGTAMIGHGIDAAAGGIAMLSLGNPAGAAPLATGIALIGGGLAMGGFSTGVEHVLGGGTVGKPLPNAATHGGINTGGGGGSGRSGGGGGGPTVINITYGAAGPAPQDTGRAVYDALRAHGAATGLTIPNTPQGPRR